MGSINIPFTIVQLSQTNLETLGPQAKSLAENKDSIVVIISPNDQNNALVSNISYSTRVQISERCPSRN